MFLSHNNIFYKVYFQCLFVFPDFYILLLVFLENDKENVENIKNFNKSDFASLYFRREFSLNLFY